MDGDPAGRRQRPGRVECRRPLDRVRLRAGVSDPDVALRRAAVGRVREAVHVVQPTWTLLARAAPPLPTELGTLDAIHLATAMAWREAAGTELIMATHDAALGLAARASGVRVVGVP